MNKIDPKLYERLTLLIEGMAYEFVGCQLLSQGRSFLFRIYIDSQEPHKGVTADDCSKVSRQVSALLDVLDVIQGHYILEVSSPGIDRPLFEIKHYRQFLGKRVKLKLYMPVNERRQYQGILQRVEEEYIYLLVDESEQEIRLPFSIIEKANLVEGEHFQKTKQGKQQ
jgi:ribosome maturation factor RimP